jgi:CubicO group peptidase (beta-lactamase class C family)
MERKIEARILRAITGNVFPGCTVGFVSKNTRPVVLAFGRQTYDPASPAITRDSIFDVASITKAIPTASLALMLIDSGKLMLDDLVARHVPEFRNSRSNKVLIRHLLTQTLNYNFRLSSFKDLGAKAVLDTILTGELADEPGTTFFYSNATSILLGMVVEKIFGECLAVSARREFFAPLGMARTSFFTEEFTQDDIVPTEADSWRGRVIRGEVHDESAWVLRRIMVPGSAGLFSTAPDILRFMNMLLNDGLWEGARYFSTARLAEMSTNQIAVWGVHTGLGWELSQKRYMGNACSPSTIGKTGFTGCVCMADMAAKTALVILSNYTFPVRKADGAAIDSVRRDVADIVFSSLNP